MKIWSRSRMENETTILKNEHKIFDFLSNNSKINL